MLKSQRVSLGQLVQAGIDIEAALAKAGFDLNQ